MATDAFLPPLQAASKAYGFAFRAFCSCLRCTEKARFGLSGVEGDRVDTLSPKSCDERLHAPAVRRRCVARSTP